MTLTDLCSFLNLTDELGQVYGNAYILLVLLQDDLRIPCILVTLCGAAEVL